MKKRSHSQAGGSGNLGSASGKLEVGVRPEFVRFAEAGDTGGLPARVVKVSDAGRFRIVEAEAAETRIKLLVPEGGDIPQEQAHETHAALLAGTVQCCRSAS